MHPEIYETGNNFFEQETRKKKTGNEEDSDDDEGSVVDDDDSDIKDGVFIFYCATTETYPYYTRLGSKLTCLVEKGQVKDWNKVKKNIRECAEMEGAVTKSNKPLVLKSFLKEDNWSLASMCCHLAPSSSFNTSSSDTHLTDKYIK
eukprot:490852-Ditylum_brightwellii.AAC.1